MEKGFYHPTRGYWQVNDYHPPVVVEPIDDSEGNIITTPRPHHFTDDYPEGTTEVPLKPRNNCEWDSETATWIDIIPSFNRAQSPPLTPRQFRLGFLKAGHAPSQIEAVIETMPEGPDKETARIEWEFAGEFERLHPLVISLSTSLGFTPEQVDTMWEDALEL